MNRRDFIAGLAGATAWPIAAGAQQPDDLAKVLLSRILYLQAANIADRIDQFIEGVRSQVGWTVQLPWSPGTIEARRFDSLRLLRQAQAVLDLALRLHREGAASRLAYGDGRGGEQGRLFR